MQNPWQIIDSKEVYDNPWINLTEYNVINPMGGKGIYGKVHFKNRAIGVLAIDEEDNIYLVGQHRFPLNTYSWELPEGGCPENEVPLHAAKRELLEETGLQAEDWQPFLTMHLSNSVTDELAIVFIARQLSQHESHLEDTEDITVKRFCLDDILAQINKGEITDSITVASIYKYAYTKIRNG